MLFLYLRPSKCLFRIIVPTKYLSSSCKLETWSRVQGEKSFWQDCIGGCVCYLWLRLGSPRMWAPGCHRALGGKGEVTLEWMGQFLCLVLALFHCVIGENNFTSLDLSYIKCKMKQLW